MKQLKTMNNTTKTFKQLKKYSPLGLDSIMPFGSHKGKTIKEIADSTPSYLEWCLKNVEGFCLQHEAYDYFMAALEDFATLRNLTWSNDPYDEFDWGDLEF